MQTLLQDADLVKSYVQGDEQALAELINRHSAKVYNFIYSKVLDKMLLKTYSRIPLLRL